MSYRLITFLLVMLIVRFTVAENRSAAEPLDSGPASSGEKKGSTGAVIAVSCIAAAAIGTGGYFLVRRHMREKHHGDSIIAIVEGAWDSAGALYATEQYRLAIGQLQKISGYWYEYERYSARYRQKRHVHSDSIRAVIASCDFLEGMIPQVRLLSDSAEKLPVDEFSLSKISRRDLTGSKNYLRHAMDSIMSVNSNHRDALQYSFRQIDRRIRLVDSLEEAMYPMQKTAFATKAKFFYNRAVAADDSTALRSFVEDCDYYGVEKEWCQRARIAVREQGTVTTDPVVTPGGKMSTKDSIQFAWQEAIQSKRIEVLEAYINKYSARKYRPYLAVAKIDSVKAAVRLLRREIDGQVAFNKANPRFGSSDDIAIPITAKGLSRATEEAFGAAWKSLHRETAKLPSIRLPASLNIDYTRQPPLLMLDAVISPETDVEKTVVNSRTSYRITCLLPAMKLLHHLKMLTIAMINESRASGTKLDNVFDYEIKKVRAAAYIIRLRKPAKSGSILFYARESGAADTDTNRVIQFYDFYDLAAAGHESRRFPIYPGSLPSVIPSLASDSLEQAMGADFFGEE